MSGTVLIALEAIPQIIALFQTLAPDAEGLVAAAQNEIAALTSGSPVTVTLADVATAVTAESAANAALQATQPAAEPS
jgi:hypothetical protein